MAKQTIDVPTQLISSIIIGFILAVITIVSMHFSGKWTAYPVMEYGLFTGPKNYVSLTDKVEHYTYNCPFDDVHIFKGNGIITMGEVISNESTHITITSAFESTFEKHWVRIFMVTLIYVFVILFFRNFKFKLS